ncbi:MAG: hypothetical protein JWM28_2351 [Chitinophagaceae bacterium]|nr:hypothetical protein [Chitinophagaceae bacterium]
MKKNAFKITVRRVASSFLVSTVLFLSTASAQGPVVAAFRESPVEVKCVGSDNDSYVFNVAYDNDNGDKFSLRILDSAGNLLFAGTYNDRKFNKKFKLEKEGNDKLNFVIKNLSDNTIQAFEITTTTRIVEDVVVKKV